MLLRSFSSHTFIMLELHSSTHKPCQCMFCNLFCGHRGLYLHWLCAHYTMRLCCILFQKTETTCKRRHGRCWTHWWGGLGLLQCV